MSAVVGRPSFIGENNSEASHHMIISAVMTFSKTAGESGQDTFPTFFLVIGLETKNRSTGGRRV